MANDRLLMGWANEASDAKASGLAAGYPALNALDEEDLSLVARSATTTLTLDQRLGQGNIGASTGVPTTGAPSATISKIVADPTGRYVFAIENGALRTYTFNQASGTYGVRLTGRAGSTLTADTDVAVAQESATRLLVAIAGNRAAGAGFEIYPFDLATGAWGARSSDGASAVAQNGRAICWLNTDQATTWAIACGYTSSPFVSMHAVTRASAAIGSKASNPGTLPAGQINSLAAFNFSGSWKVLAGIDVTPFLQAWSTTSTPDWGARYANPTALAGIPSQRAIAVSRASYSGNAYVAVGHATTPFISVLPFGSSAFGTKLANPATLPSQSVWAVAFGPDDAHLAYADIDDVAAAYVFTPTAGGSIGAQLVSFDAGAAIQCAAACWSADGETLLFGFVIAPYIGAYPFSATAADGAVDFVLVHATNASLTATIQIKLDAASVGGSSEYDSGAIDFFPAGVTAAMIDHYPRSAWIVLPAQKTARYARITIADPDNPDGFVEVGFVGVYRAVQFERAHAYGWRAGIEPLSGLGELESGRITVEPRDSRRSLRFTLPLASETELLEQLHPLQMQGPQAPVAALPDPNESTGLKNFMLGVWGPLRIEDELANASHGRYATTLTVLEQK